MQKSSFLNAIVGASVIAWSGLAFFAWRYSPPQVPLESIDDVRLHIYHAEDDPKGGSTLVDPALIPSSITQQRKSYLVVALGYCQSCSTRRFNLKSIPARFRGRMLGIAEGDGRPDQSPFKPVVSLGEAQYRRLNAVWDTRLYYVDANCTLLERQGPRESNEEFLRRLK